MQPKLITMLSEYTKLNQKNLVSHKKNWDSNYQKPQLQLCQQVQSHHEKERKIIKKRFIFQIFIKKYKIIIHFIFYYYYNYIQFQFIFHIINLTYFYFSSCLYICNLDRFMYNFLYLDIKATYDNIRTLQRKIKIYIYLYLNSIFIQ